MIIYHKHKNQILAGTFAGSYKGSGGINAIIEVVVLICC